MWSVSRLPRQRSVRDTRSPITCALAAALLLWLALSALATAQSLLDRALQVQATVGFLDRFRHGAWTPVAVELSHPSGYQGVLEVAVPRSDLFSQAQSYVRLTQPFELAPGESRTYWFTVPLHASPYPLVVAIKDRNGRTTRQIEKELRGRAVEGPFFLVLDPAATGWTFLAGEAAPPSSRPAPPVVVHARSAGELPGDALAYAALSAVIVRDTFALTSLDPDQVAAIAEYVRSGGHLILAGGSSPPRFPLSWMAWLPEITGRVVGVEIGELLLPAWEFDPVITAARGSRGELTTSRPAGAGVASIIAYDPSSPALRGTEGDALRGQAAAVALSRAALAGGLSITDDDVWSLLNMFEIAYGDNQSLTVLVIIYALLVSGTAYATMHRPRLHYVSLAVVIAASAVYAYHYTLVTGVRDQMGFAEVQLTRGVIPGIAQNRTYLLAVSLARTPRDLELSGPRPQAFPAPYRAEADIVLQRLASGSRVTGIAAQSPVRLFHDSFEEIDILVKARSDESEPLVIVNNSDYELRHVHYIERQRMASLGHVPPRSTLEWTAPQERVASAGWMGMTLQAGLLRQPPHQRPSEMDIRLLALAADRGLGETLISSEHDRPFIVALIEPRPLLTLKPAGQRVTRRVLIFPAFDEAGASR